MVVIYPEICMINERIKREVCHESIEKLRDENLMSEYMATSSYKKKETIITTELKNEGIDDETIKRLTKKLALDFILPPGVKGVVRGNQFNSLVKKFIQRLPLDTDRFEICFEKKCMDHITPEIPDWYIKEKTTGKVLIGMNQVDLWGGGAQSNRGSKYILDTKYSNESCKLLCVVCNETQIKTNKGKLYNLFKVGFKHNTLCYMNNLHNIINEYFD